MAVPCGSGDATRYNTVPRLQVASRKRVGCRLQRGVVASCNSDSCMLIDVHAHFYHAPSPRADWRERNASRLAAGRKIGVTIHVASILGSWGRTSPIYFPSPQDVEAGNSALLALEREHPHLIRGYVPVNPNYTSQARAETATPNVYVDLSGSGVDGGMLEACLEAAGVERLLWGTDLTIDTGWAKLRYLERLLPPRELELVQWRNAARIFPRGAFPAD